MCNMTTDLEVAARAYRRAQKAVEERRAELRRLVIEARDRGERQSDIAKQIEFTREAVRQIYDAHDKAAAEAATRSDS